MKTEEIAKDPLMSFKIVKTEEGEFVMAVKVHKFSVDAEGNTYADGTVNEWTLGLNEEIAQAKTKTIIDTYLKGLEFVQSEVRKVFANEEDKPTS